MNLAVDPSVDPILDQIRSRVEPTALAHEQTMPVAEGLAELFAERALVRGRTLACTGPAGTSAAMELVAAAVVAGSWLAVVDVPTFGLDAASEAGIPLERVVAITTTPPARPRHIHWQRGRRVGRGDGGRGGWFRPRVVAPAIALAGLGGGTAQAVDPDPPTWRRGRVARQCQRCRVERCRVERCRVAV